MAEPPRIVAYRTMDCATKTRLYFKFPAPLDRDFLAFFPGAEVTIDEFSRCVAGAKDHFKLFLEDRWYATGVLGEPWLTVTFWKERGREIEQDLAGFESTLLEKGLGRVEHLASREGLA